ncbi:MAG: T9SS type A sorting domain-containing protein [bacterium]
MKNLSIILFLLLFLTTLAQGALTSAPEDFMGRVPIPLGVEVEVLKFKSDQIVYAGTNGAGLFVSYDCGVNWVKLTGFPEKFSCIKDMIIADNKDIYVATYGGGIYFSNNNGATFTAKNKGITNLFVQAIAMTKDGMLLCGTYGSGIFYSVDAGANWVRTDEGLRYDNINSIQIMNNGYIVAGSYGGGFYVSRDTCKTWLLSNTQLDNKFINDLVKDLNGKLYAATNGSGVMFTADGIQWLTYSNKWHVEYDAFTQPLLDTSVTSVGTNAYQNLMGTRSAGMYYWDGLWNAWQSTGDITAGITACDVSPNGTTLITRAYGDVARSTDNGLHWYICAEKIADVELEAYNLSSTIIKVFVADDNSLISVADSTTKQKLYSSNNHGNTWQYLNSVATTEVYDIEKLPDGNLFIAAERGIYKYSIATDTFELICDNPSKPNSSYRFLEIDYNPVSKTIFAIYKLVENGQPPNIEYRLYKSINKGQSWTYTEYGAIKIQNLNCESNGAVFLSIGGDLSRSVDDGGNFSTFSVIPNTVAYGKEGKIYYWNTNNEIFVDKNKTGNWTQIPFNPVILDVNATWLIQSLASNIYGDLYVAIRIQMPIIGYIYELYMTNDGGKNWKTMRGCYNMDKIRTICADNNGYTYFLTNALYKVLNPNNLNPPIITSPKDEAVGEELHPVFAWKRVALAEEYELQIDQTDLFYSAFETNVTGDTTCKSVLTLKSNQQYYWRIRSKTHSARSDWRINSFYTGMEAPFLISPEKGKLGVPLNAELKWHKKVDATHYSIQVAEDENFTKIVYSQDNHPDTTITSDKLIGLKTYYWRVKAFTPTNTSGWSEVWIFRTVMGPPRLIYPKDNSMDKLLTEQFKWRKSAEAQTYFIQVATDTAFSSIFYEGTAGVDTFKVIDNMLPETDYYWHVSSVNTEGTSEYSERWTFRTSFKPVQLQAPANEKVNVPLDTKYTWLEHNGGSQYQIQISKTIDFKTPIVDEKVNNLLEFQTDKLEYYKDYFWRVRLVVGTRVGLWSEVWKFKTGIQSAELLNPPDKSIDQPTTIKFKWYEVVGAKFYQLQISKNDNFTDLVYSMDSLSKAEQYVEDLEPEILYYWRVRAWNMESYGTSQWSQVWTFTTGQVTLILRNPKTGTAGVAIPTVLTWFTATTAEYYHLQVAKDADFANIICDKDSIYKTEYTLPITDVTVSTNYFWHVKGVSKTYATPWSDTWQFTTGEVSVKESPLFTSIKLYPNPTGSKAELSINYAETSDAKILISTAEGKIIKTDVIRLLVGETRYEIDTEHLTSGSYYITIVTPSGYVTRELVVVK